jgi:hypothetical protein
MEGWLPDFLQQLETFASEIEQLWTQVAKDIDAIASEFVEVSEEIAEQIHRTIETEIEQHCIDFIDPILETFLGFESAFEDAAQPVVHHTVEPILNNHPACVGCRHYHGQVYSGVPLICGMHPYGWDGEQCPDWESIWKIED